MAFFLEGDELVSEGMKRIIRELVDDAIDNLTNPAIDRDEGVHNARKGFKRIRAALRLVRDGIGVGAYRRENVFFRDCGRLLSPARDSFVMVEALDLVTSYYAAQLPPNAFADMREKLLERYQIISRQVFYESGAVEKVVEALQEAGERILTLPLEGDDFGVLGKGLQRIYRSGRRAMGRAYADPNVESFHEWRKQVKYLLYQLEIIEPLRPTLPENLTDELHQLSDYLGSDHDLAELRLTLVANPQLVGDKRELLTLIEQRRAELETAARPLGERIYLDKPYAFFAIASPKPSNAFTRSLSGASA